MEELEFDKIRVEKVNLANAGQVKKVYKNSFPSNERVAFRNLFTGVFKDFVLYGFYIEDILVGFVHLVNADDFVHLNYLAVTEKYRDRGIGSYIINLVKNKFNNKTLVVDVENLDDNANNNEQRYRRLKFYYKNGFCDGESEYDWEGTRMFYIHTNTISNDKFMKHIVKCFPTISNIKPHKSNKEKMALYLKNLSKTQN